MLLQSSPFRAADPLKNMNSALPLLLVLQFDWLVLSEAQGPHWQFSIVRSDFLWGGCYQVKLIPYENVYLHSQLRYSAFQIPKPNSNIVNLQIRILFLPRAIFDGLHRISELSVGMLYRNARNQT
jgi:hypothetical protein